MAPPLLTLPWPPPLLILVWRLSSSPSPGRLPSAPSLALPAPSPSLSLALPAPSPSLSLALGGPASPPTLPCLLLAASWFPSDGSSRASPQDYLPTLPHRSSFTYYRLDAHPSGVSVLRLDPPGGPELGGTLVRVTGSGFDDVGGLRCQFDREPPVPASHVDSEHVTCVSPARTPGASSFVDGALGGAFGGTFDERAVEVTINGQLHALTSSAIRFAYHTQAGVAVSRIYPRGGPRGGGTAVTVWGAGFRELGHGRHSDVPTAAGLHCRFGSLELVPATLATDGGGGPQRLLCAAPALPETGRCEALVVHVTNNADNPPGGASLTDDDVAFSYYDSFDAREDGTPTPYGATLLAHGPEWTGGDVL